MNEYQEGDKVEWRIGNRGPYYLNGIIESISVSLGITQYGVRLQNGNLWFSYAHQINMRKYQ
jgi:hypothetical protein